MLNHHSLIDQSFVNRVRKVQSEVQRRKQSSVIANQGAYVAHLWVRWLNVSVLASGKGE